MGAQCLASFPAWLRGNEATLCCIGRTQYSLHCDKLHCGGHNIALLEYCNSAVDELPSQSALHRPNCQLSVSISCRMKKRKKMDQAFVSCSIAGYHFICMMMALFTIQVASPDLLTFATA